MVVVFPQRLVTVSCCEWEPKRRLPGQPTGWVLSPALPSCGCSDSLSLPHSSVSPGQAGSKGSLGPAGRARRQGELWGEAGQQVCGVLVTVQGELTEVPVSELGTVSQLSLTCGQEGETQWGCEQTWRGCPEGTGVALTGGHVLSLWPLS